MIIKRLNLENFRNYEKASFDLLDGTNIVYGENAQGKTNLLEAVYYLASGKSFRGVRDRDLIRNNAEYAHISAEIEAPELDYVVEATLSSQKRRRLAINGVPLRTLSELSGRVSTVLFSPEDLYLIRDGAAVRRKFMDSAFSQLRPVYAQLISKYNRLHNHKTRILRDWREKPSLLDTLDSFNFQIADIGALIIGYRARFLDKITTYATQIHREISGGREELSLKYKTVSTIKNPFDETEKIKNCILHHMKTHRSAELSARSALSGPHKDDIDIYINGKSAKTFASQGQTRTAALSLKMAERELFLQDSGVNPILLLDDVLSELDDSRCDYVLNKISSGQVIITLCNGENYDFVTAVHSR